jgi:hypothetical protein
MTTSAQSTPTSQSYTSSTTGVSGSTSTTEAEVSTSTTGTSTTNVILTTTTGITTTTFSMTTSTTTSSTSTTTSHAAINCAFGSSYFSPGGSQYQEFCNLDIAAGDLANAAVLNWDACLTMCDLNLNCVAVVFDQTAASVVDLSQPGQCFLKDSTTGGQNHKDYDTIGYLQYRAPPSTTTTSMVTTTSGMVTTTSTMTTTSTTSSTPAPTAAYCDNAVYISTSGGYDFYMCGYTDVHGHDIALGATASLQQCEDLCNSSNSCSGFTLGVGAQSGCNFKTATTSDVQSQSGSYNLYFKIPSPVVTTTTTAMVSTTSTTSAATSTIT